MNRLNRCFETDKPLLSIYFTAGYPSLEDTMPILKELQKAKVDFVEIGLPFSDPLADGPTIQDSSTEALKNGMNTETLFQQLKEMRNEIHIPILIMGYFNPILQYGVEKFCEQCQTIGIDGLIVPDLPLDVYEKEYKELFLRSKLHNILLITPQTPNDRIQLIDSLSNGFIYTVSSSSVTGGSGLGEEQLSYLKRIQEMNLKNKTVTGFGISDSKSYEQAIQFTHGAIIGSAFIKFLKSNSISNIGKFIKKIR